MRAFLLATVLIGCSGGGDAAPERSRGAERESERRAPEPAWRALAGRAHHGGQRLAAADQALGRLDAARRAAVEQVLDRMAALGTGPDALRNAGTLAEQSASVGNDPEWAGSGTAPGTGAVHAGSLAVMCGIAAASVAAGSSPESLLTTIESMPMPPRFNSGGREDDAPYRAMIAAEVRAGRPE
jgi:hypothetical protein